MKKLIVVLALSVAFVSCNKTTEAKDFKTGYVDIVELMDKSTEAKDIEAKFKGKADEMGSQLKVEATKLDNEKKSFQTDAQKMANNGHNKNMANCNNANNNCNMRNKECYNSCKEKAVKKWIA